MFNIGEKVRVVRDTCSHKEPIGSILTIREINFSSSLGYIYNYNGGQHPFNYILDEDIELLSKVEPKKLLMNYLCSHKSQ